MSASDKQPPSSSKKARLAAEGNQPVSALAVANVALAATLLTVHGFAEKLHEVTSDALHQAMLLCTASVATPHPLERVLAPMGRALWLAGGLLCLPIVVATIAQLAQAKGRTRLPSLSFSRLKPFQGFTSRWAHEARWSFLAKVISTAGAILLAGRLAADGGSAFSGYLRLARSAPWTEWAMSDLGAGYRAIGLQLVFGAVAGGLFDVVMRRRGFDLRHGMDREEQKKEYKEQEGSPEVKAAQQQRRFELMMAPPARAMRMADVVVRNPTHIAVAVVDAFTERPWILMAEEGVSAQRVLRLARRYRRPSVRSVALARALLRAGEGADVPADVIAAVTEAAYWAHGLVPPSDEATADSTGAKEDSGEA